MNVNQKLSFTGERLINHYGCYACHDIQGFEHVNPVGTELTEEGSKSVHKLDFGLIHLDHTNYAWFEQKLRNPRIFDEGKVKARDEKLKMPNFNFTDEEVDAVTTALAGLVDNTSVERKKMPRTTRNLHLEAGRKSFTSITARDAISSKGREGRSGPPSRIGLSRTTIGVTPRRMR